MLQQIHPLDLLNRLAAEVVSSLSDIDLLASMRVKEEQATYDAEDQLPFGCVLPLLAPDTGEMTQPNLWERVVCYDHY